MENYIKGIFRQTIFRSDKGYIIGLFKIKETDIESMKSHIGKTITFTGYFHELYENDSYYFKGEEVIHPKYGFQFNVTEYDRVKPEDKDGLVAFLASDLFKGIGEKLAQNIVDYLGEQALDKILEDKECLLEVPKMTKKKADSIYNSLLKYEESHQTIVYLTELGFTLKDALLIYNRYTSNTNMILEHNIYKIIDDIDDISFPIVDQVACKRGVDSKSELRIKACILYVMRELTFKNGDTYLYKEEISEAVCSTLMQDISLKEIEELLVELNSEMQVEIQDDKYYLMDLYEAEYNIIQKISYLLHKDKRNYSNLDNKIKLLEEKYDIIYNKEQKEAIKKALTENIVIITGGPGTGKTTIIKAIVELYQMLKKCNRDQLKKLLTLLAPTGRASKRMSESTMFGASTIHRFLKWNLDTDEFSVNEYNPDFSEFIIIDEASMIDIYLMDNLLKGLTNNIQLVLVGDVNQLPSVGPGRMLKDLIDSELIETIELDLLYRQAEESYIPVLAQEIRDNNLNNFLAQKNDYLFLSCSSDSLIHNLTNICHQVLDHGYDYKRVQLMAPMYAGINGIDNLNMVLQDIFNPSSLDKKEIKYGNIIYRESDKVLQLVNRPDDNVFNGDVGIITEIREENKTSSGKKEVLINFDGNIVHYQTKDLNNIKHGFIISIHKAQGSEFEMVIIPIVHDYQRMLYRKLIYTGVTRARKKLILIGEPNAFVRSVNNNYEQKRKTDLSNNLKEKCIIN